MGGLSWALGKGFLHLQLGKTRGGAGRLGGSRRTTRGWLGPALTEVVSWNRAAGVPDRSSGTSVVAAKVARW